MPKPVHKIIGTRAGQVYLGIDPGKSGGIAYVTQGGLLLEYHPMPSTDYDIWKIFRGNKGVTKAYIEKVHAMPKQGGTSMFTFGMNYGKLLMALTAASIPFQEVTPHTWQKEIGITSKAKGESTLQHKDRIRAKCQQLFPKTPLWQENLGYQRSVTDAIMIALYCQRTENFNGAKKK